MRTVAETLTDAEYDAPAARVDAIVARLDGEPLRIADARDVVVCVPHAWTREAVAALGGDDFAAAVDAVSRAPGEIVVVVATGGALDVRVIQLRAMQRGGAA